MANEFTGEISHIPQDPSLLSEMFRVLAAYNAAEDSGSRFAEHILDGFIKSKRQSELTTMGVDEQDAAQHIREASGNTTESVEFAKLDFEAIGERYSETLSAYGLGISHDATRDVFVVVRNGELLTQGLEAIDETAVDDEIRDGLGSMLKEFIDPLPWTVINNYPELVDALELWPYWMKDGAIPEPENDQIMRATLEYAGGVIKQCERLGVDPESVNRLRNLNRCHQEGVLVEWALANEMGCFGPQYGFNAALQPYRGWRTEADWGGFWRMIDSAQSSAGGDSRFVADLAETMTVNINIFMRALMAGKLYLDEPSFETAARENADMIELQFARRAKAGHRFIEILLNVRGRLQALRSNY